MGRAKHSKKLRDGTTFLAIPHVVLDSAAYKSLSAVAVALLIDIARQLSGYNNGRLVACMSVLKERGWTSNSTLTRARRELEAAGLLFQTRIGMRPNRAAWFALTWAPLHWVPGMECSPQAYPRGLYLDSATSKEKRSS